MSNKKQHDEEHSKIYKVWLWIKQWWLPIAILLITSTGLACALSIPQQVFETPREPANDKSAPVLLAQSNLRLAFLYITGGAIAVVGLIETFRKNNNEKLKNNQDKEKNDREHLRQVRADRRERYTKAVEQLGNEKAPIRMGGVYTLVGLVDEWLEEKSLSDDERFKEGQVIIKNLCAYIRSPFTLTSHYDELIQDTPDAEGVYQDKVQEFYADKATLESEADVRLSIIKEIHDRIQGPDKNTPGAWSDFEYDFSGSTFFYPIDLTNSYYAKPINFSGSTYKGWANFRSSTYKGETYFTDSTYKDEADFRGSTYEGWADFRGSTYEGWADFTGSTYETADFHGSTYQGGADFTGSTYQGRADFTGSTYQDVADFRGSTYQALAYFSRSTYQALADFGGSIYQALADFTDSTYHALADFSGSTYKGGAYFSRSTYQEEAYFTGSTYNDVADFSGSIFYQKVYFGADGDNSSFSRFTDCAPQFYDETNHKNTLFGSPDNDFSTENGRGYPIYRGLDGLPLGCKFLTSEQKEYLEYKFQEIDETKNKILKVKDPKEKAELSKKLQALTEELHEWREEAITVKMEGTALGKDNN